MTDEQTRAAFKHGSEHAPQPDVDRFISKVNATQPDECWEWNGTKDTDGYGVLKIAKRMYKAHRLAFQFAFGWLPSRGYFICHKCDVRECVNPRHLYAGLPRDNSFDMVSRGRSARGEHNPQSTLNETQVRSILTQFSQGQSKRALAREYGVTPTAIYLIVRGKSWRYLSAGVQ
jgi:hypothetical protein